MPTGAFSRNAASRASLSRKACSMTFSSSISVTATSIAGSPSKVIARTDISAQNVLPSTRRS